MTASTDDHASEDDSAFIKTPPDLQNIIGVDQKFSRWTPLDELMVQDRNAFHWPGRGRIRGWEHRNDRLYLFPAPSSSSTVKFRMLYVPVTPAFAVGEDETPDDVEVDVFLPEGEQYLIWYVVVELKGQERGGLPLRHRPAPALRGGRAHLGRAQVHPQPPPPSGERRILQPPAHTLGRGVRLLVSNQLKIGMSLSYEKGLKKISKAISNFPITVTGTVTKEGVQNVGNSEEAIDLGGVSAGGYCFLRNLAETGTAYLSVRQATSASDLIRMGPGEFCLFRLDDDATAPFVIASSGTIDMEIILLSD